MEKRCYFDKPQFRLPHKSYFLVVIERPDQQRWFSEDTRPNNIPIGMHIPIMITKHAMNFEIEFTFAAQSSAAGNIGFC